MRHLFRVRAIRITMVSMLALLWVVLTSHCRIEAVPGFEFLRCSAEEPSKGGDPCEGAACCLLESAQFHAPRQQEVAPVVTVALAPGPALPTVDVQPLFEVTLGILTAAPPEASTCWRFYTRTALPPRAPSVVS